MGPRINLHGSVSPITDNKHNSHSVTLNLHLHFSLSHLSLQKKSKPLFAFSFYSSLPICVLVQSLSSYVLSFSSLFLFFSVFLSSVDITELFCFVRFNVIALENFINDLHKVLLQVVVFLQFNKKI